MANYKFVKIKLNYWHLILTNYKKCRFTLS